MHELHNVSKVNEDTGNDEKESEPKPIYEGRFTLITLGLIDFVCYTGILPFLSDGVGLLPEQRPKSVLKSRHQSEKESLSVDRAGSDEREILQFTVEGILLMLRDGDRGIAHILRERCLADLLAGLCELTIGPKALDDSEKLRKELDMILEKYGSSILSYMLFT